MPTKPSYNTCEQAWGRVAHPFGLTGLLRYGWTGGPSLWLDRVPSDLGAPSFSPAFGERVGAGNPQPEGRHNRSPASRETQCVSAYGRLGLPSFCGMRFLLGPAPIHKIEWVALESASSAANARLRYAAVIVNRLAGRSRDL